jgi:hypothetical protein
MIIAVYSGDDTFATSASSSIDQTVMPQMVGTNTILTSSLDPSMSGQSVTFSATVSSVGGVPTGTVTFMDGNTVLGTGSLVNGVATFNISTLSIGNHPITASYGGDSSFLPSTSRPLNQLVNPLVLATNTTLCSSLNPSTYGQSVTFTATVTSSSGTPTGTITFMDGSTTLAVVTISNGVAQYNSSTLSIASHSIKAVYSGNSTYNASSATLTQVVNGVPATLGGHTYSDKTGDGKTADDMLMPGVKVLLFRDANNNSTLDSADGAAIASKTSDSNGAYSFGNLQPGSYIVEEVVPTGYVRTQPLTSDYYAISASYAQNATNLDFDNFQKCACQTDLSSFYFTDNGRKITDLRGQTHAGDTVSVTFTLKPGDSDQFNLVVYSAPDATFNANDAAQQQVIADAGGTFTGGTHTLSVKLPKTGHYQIDFICGSVIYHFGPAGSNIFYTPQGRLISADNE